jgi:hypothetical protein
MGICQAMALPDRDFHSLNPANQNPPQPSLPQTVFAEHSVAAAPMPGRDQQQEKLPL